MRVSTEKQDAENQRRDIESIASPSTEWVVEHGSAWKKDGLELRPEFQHIVALVKQRKVKHLYVWDLDRLYRKRKAAVGFLKLCKAMGTIVISYRQKYLLEVERAPEPWNEIIYELIIQVLAAQAEEESQKKSDRIKAKREIWVRPPNKKEWGRPAAAFNRFRAAELLQQGKSLEQVAAELGVAKATIFRFKKSIGQKNASFIKEGDDSITGDIEP
jgi:DNA invertase Pin-like site-specific DNA recombinase